MDQVEVELLDLRDEHDFNLFHVGGALGEHGPEAGAADAMDGAR